MEHHWSFGYLRSYQSAEKKIRSEAEDAFHELYQRASNMCWFTETRGKCEGQKHRTNFK